MNEEYLKGLFESLGGEKGLGGKFEDWTSAISTNEEYKKGLFESLGGEQGLGGKYADWDSSVFGVSSDGLTYMQKELRKKGYIQEEAKPLSSTPDREFTQDGQVGTLEKPVKTESELYADKEKSEMLAGVQSPEEKDKLSKAIDRTNEYFYNQGGQTPYQKMQTLNARLAELNREFDSRSFANMNEEDLNKVESDYKKKAKDIAVEIGLEVGADGNIKPYDNELNLYKEKLANNIEYEEQPKDKGFFSNLASSLASGYERASGAALDLLGTISGLNYFDSYRDLAQGNRYRADLFKEQANKYDRSIEEYAKSGELDKAAGLAVTSAVESLPYMIPAMVNPQYGVYVMGGMSGIDKYRELDETKIPEWEKVYNAVSSGAFEAIFEKLGTGAILARSKRAMLELGEKKGKEAIVNAVNKTVENSASKIGKMPEWVKEGLSEVATGLGQDLTDKVTVNPEKKIGENSVDNFVVGAVMGKVFALPQDVAKGMDRLKARDFAKNVIDKLPADMSIETKIDLGWKIAERDRLQEAENKLDDKFKGKYSARIVQLNDEIDNIAKAYKGEVEVPTVGEMQPAGEEQAQVDYLTEKGVTIPDGTTTEQLAQLYEEEKAKEQPVEAAEAPKAEEAPIVPAEEKEAVKEPELPQAEPIEEKSIIGKKTDLLGEKKTDVLKTVDEYVAEEDVSKLPDKGRVVGGGKGFMSGKYKVGKEDVIEERTESQKAFIENANKKTEVIFDGTDYWTADREERVWDNQTTKEVVNIEDKPKGEAMSIYDMLIKQGRVTESDVNKILDSAGIKPELPIVEPSEEGKLGEDFLKENKYTIRENKNPFTNEINYKVVDENGVEVSFNKDKNVAIETAISEIKKLKEEETWASLPLNEFIDKVKQKMDLKGGISKSNATSLIKSFGIKSADKILKGLIYSTKNISVPSGGFGRTSKPVYLYKTNDVLNAIYNEIKQGVSPESIVQQPKQQEDEKGISEGGQETIEEGLQVAEESKVVEATGIKPKNLRDVYKAGREVFGLNKVQSLAQAIIFDKAIATIAKRRGVSKQQAYSEIQFKKADKQFLDKAGLYYQAAWHGSPYQFDKFTTEKIGTGEGAQAFGWGLYFTDVKGIAEQYAADLTKEKFDMIGDYFELDDAGDFTNLDDYEYYKNELGLLGINKRGEKALDDLIEFNRIYIADRKKFAKSKKPSDLKYVKHLDEQIELSSKAIASAQRFLKSIPVRSLYKVELHKGKTPEQYDWLVWDKEVDEKQIQQIGNEDKFLKENLSNWKNEGVVPASSKSNQLNGNNLYNYLSSYFGSPKEASLFLLRAGIGGIKYPAESIARGATSDTARGFNYVVFDENAVTIEEVIKFQKNLQKYKGAVDLQNSRAVVYALTNPDVSTPLHELAHIYEKYMTSAEKNAVLSWTGQKTWSVDTSEKFARGFERYLAEGVAPTEKLKAVFERFKTWLTEIYNGITGSEIDLTLNADMKRVYDSILTGKKYTPAKQVTKVEPKAEVKSYDDVDSLLFQDIKFQGEVEDRHTRALNNLIDHAVEEKAEDVAEFVRVYLAGKGNPISEQLINDVLKQRGYAKETRKAAQKPVQKERAVKGKVQRLRVRDAEQDREPEEKVTPREEEGKRVSLAGKRFFNPNSKVPKEVQEAINEKGIHLYEPTKLPHAEAVAKEFAANSSIEEIASVLTEKFGNEAVYEITVVASMQRLTSEIKKRKDNGEPINELVDLQLKLANVFVSSLHGASLTMRASQVDTIREYLAPETTVRMYTKSTVETRKQRKETKYFKRKKDVFTTKTEQEHAKAIEDTLNNESVKKAVKQAQNKLTVGKVEIKKEKTPAQKKRDDLIKKWKDALKERNKVKFQAAKLEYNFTEEDLQFGRELVNTYLEDGIYNRTAIFNKLKKQFNDLGITISDGILEELIPDTFKDKNIDDLFEEQQLDKAAERLAGRIFGTVVDQPKPEDPLSVMVNTLTSKFKERTKAEVKEKKSDLEKVVDAIRNRKDYKEVWDEARDLALKKIDENIMLDDVQRQEAIDKVNAAYNDATNFTFTENQVRSMIRKVIKDRNINLNDVIRSHQSVMAATRQSIAKTLVDMSGLDEADAKIVEDAVSKVWERILTDRANTLINQETNRLKKQATNEVEEIDKRIVKTESQRLLELILLGAFRDNAFIEAYSTVHGIPKVSQEHVDNIHKMAEEIRDTPSTQVKRMRKDDLLIYMKRIDGVNWQETLDTLWYGFVLSGVTTQTRNLLGAYMNTYGALAVDGMTRPWRIPEIIRGARRGVSYGKAKRGVILRTGKQFFESRIDAPSIAEHAANKGWTNIIKDIAMLFRFMSAVDQSALSIGKEATAQQLANEHLKVNEFKKFYDKKYRDRINQAVAELLSITPEQIKEIDKLVAEEAKLYNYTKDEQIVRKQELIDEARPIELTRQAETAASQATGNTKAYGTIGWFVNTLAKNIGSFTPITIKYKGKEYPVKIGKFLAAFTKISTNVAEFQLSFTPVGFIHALTGERGAGLKKLAPQFYRELNPSERRTAALRAAWGTVTMALIWAMLNPDDEDHWLKITANGTGNFADDEELKKTGWRPYSIFIGDTRISYKYSPFALLLAPLGYMSDRKRFVPEHKDTPEAELITKAMLATPAFIAEITPIRSMMKTLNDLWGSIKADGDMAAIAKSFGNMAKAYTSPGLVRDISKTYDFIAKDNRLDNNKFYNDFMDRTVFDLLPEDDFPAIDSWGTPGKIYFTLDEFAGAQKDDEFAELRDYHYEQGAGLFGMPRRDKSVFEVVYKDGSSQAINLSRNNREHRYLWNMVFLKTRGEELRKEVARLKALGIKGDEYIEEFESAKDKATKEAKEAVRRYTMMKPLPTDEKPEAK